MCHKITELTLPPSFQTSGLPSQGNRIKFHRGETSSTQKRKEREKIMKQESIPHIPQVFRAIRRIAPTLFFVSFMTSWFQSF